MIDIKQTPVHSSFTKKHISPNSLDKKKIALVRLRLGHTKLTHQHLF